MILEIFPKPKDSVTFWQLSHFLLRIRSAPVFSQKLQAGNFVRAINIRVLNYLHLWHFGIFKLVSCSTASEVIILLRQWSGCAVWAVKAPGDSTAQLKVL